MKPLYHKPQEFEVTLSLAEVEYIRAFTQNYNCMNEDPSNEDAEDRKIRLSLFVGASRLLGYNMNDDGTSIRTPQYTIEPQEP
jgi:hypothetical protein